MAKLPKKVPATSPPDTHTSVTRVELHEPVTPLTHLRSSDPTTPAGFVDAPQSASNLPSTLTITSIPDPVGMLLEANMKLITWPAGQAHQLRAVSGESGLFESPAGDSYAQIAGEGYFRVDRQIDGRYRLHWPENLGEPGPLLRRVEGQPLWRPELPTRLEQIPSNVITTATPPSPQPLAPALARLLTSAQDSPAGIRHDAKRRAIYVDMEDGTTFMVRQHPDGGYQQASPHALNAHGARIVQVPGTKYWRIRASEDPQQGPSKRPRLDAEPGVIEVPVAAPRTADWQTWGSATQPRIGDSIEIDGKHFEIVPQPGHADDALVFIRHPSAVAERFDDFEQMLRITPDLQPRGVVKMKPQWGGAREPKWQVIDGHPFNKTLTRYVGDTFSYMSEQSASNIARAMFLRANQSEKLNGYGLNDLFETFQYWKDRPKNLFDQKVSRHDLVDPLVLLTPRSKDANSQGLVPTASADGLQRIDFDRIPQSLFANSSPGWRRVFTRVLRENGYNVSDSFRSFQQDALMIQRQGSDLLFLMRNARDLDVPDMSDVGGSGGSLEWGTWIRKVFRMKSEPEDMRLLKNRRAENKVVYLLAQLHQEPLGPVCLSIVRDVS